MGFPVDKDETGKVVRRESTVTQEARQRCKILTHSHQVEMRAEIAQVILSEKQGRNKINLMPFNRRLIRMPNVKRVYVNY